MSPYTKIYRSTFNSRVTQFPWFFDVRRTYRLSSNATRNHGGPVDKPNNTDEDALIPQHASNKIVPELTDLKLYRHGMRQGAVTMPIPPDTCIMSCRKTSLCQTT